MKTLLVDHRSRVMLVGLPGIHELRLFPGITIPATNDSFGEILREAIGPHVDELGGEVGVDRGGAGKEFERDRAGDFQILRERGR